MRGASAGTSRGAWAWRGHAGLALTVLAVACAPLPRMPAEGLYAGELCVGTGSPAAPNCGPALVSLVNRRVKVAVADFIYDLELGNDGELELMLVHGRTMVDTFTAAYAFEGEMLRFVDVERRVYYRVRFAHPPREVNSGH